MEGQRLLEGYIGWGPAGVAVSVFAIGIGSFYTIHRNGGSLRPQLHVLDVVVVATIYGPLAFLVGAGIYLAHPSLSAVEAFLPALAAFVSAHIAVLWADRTRAEPQLPVNSVDGETVEALRRDSDYLQRLRAALNRLTVDNLVDFSEAVEFKFYAENDRVDDRIEANVVTTVTSDDAMIWRRLKSYSDTPPPEDVHDMDWKASSSSQSDAIDLLPIRRSPGQVDAVVFFPRPLRSGAPLEWTYSHKWPGFFDTLREAKVDELVLSVNSPTSAFAAVFETPFKLKSARLSPPTAGTCTVTTGRRCAARVNLSDPKEGRTYILTLEIE